MVWTRCQRPAISRVAIATKNTGDNAGVYREACGITDQANSHIYVTGGLFTERKVSLYGTDGHLRDLPDLNHGRSEHACAGFTRNNKLVRLNMWMMEMLVATVCRFSWWQVAER